MASQKRSAETRDRIIRAAAKVFSARGYEAASFREIAEEAGASRGLLTFHFETKRKLELAVAQMIHKDWAELTQAAWLASPHPRLQAVIDSHRVVVLEHREMVKLLCRLRLSASSKAPELLQLVQGIDFVTMEHIIEVAAGLLGLPRSHGHVDEAIHAQWILSGLRGIELRAASGAPDDELESAYQGLLKEATALLERLAKEIGVHPPESIRTQPKPRRPREGDSGPPERRVLQSP